MTLSLEQQIANMRKSVASQEQTVLSTRDSYHRDTEASRLRTYKGILAKLENQLNQGAST